MRIREPVVAGQFYEADPAGCRARVVELLAQGTASLSSTGRPVAGLVPHAGWIYSGAVAAEVFQVLAAAGTPDVVILFGGVHQARGRQAALFGSGRWETPLGPVDIDERLAERILGHTNLIVDEPYAHEHEHSIEVQIPFVQHVFPDAKIVPIMVPSMAVAHQVGDAVSRTLASYEYNAQIVGTTDLTHYGPSYGFAPRGVGAVGNTWAKDENDRRFIDLVCHLEAEAVVAEAAEYANACSSGAVAATIAAAQSLGATAGHVLRQTTSAEVMADRGCEEQYDSVGYAGIVFA